MSLIYSIFGWQRYLSIEQEFLDARQYVSLDQKEVYSEFFTRMVILLGAEIEGAFKTLCDRTDASKPGNIGEYKEHILGTYPGIVKLGSVVRETEEVIQPFIGWDTDPLDWWTVYTNVKHSLVDVEATSGVAMMMLAAYQLLLVLITAVTEEREQFIRAYSAVDVPKLLVPALDFASAVDDDGMLNCVFHPDELFKLVKAYENREE